MFDPDVNSPKLLNSDRLERKFASLTRARESIQGLSSWIIKHKENCQEIVQLWFECLKKDFNVLNMFYVANDVIQHCGKKKAPEYREAFASVLDKAVELQKVKEIKPEVTRVITLWQDRGLFNDNFYERLKNGLNAPAVEEKPEVEEIETTETDIIANFKLENLISSLRQLQTLENELSKKQTLLEDIEEPVITNYENVIVKLETKQEIRKFDKHQKLLEDYISLSKKVLAAEKNILALLRNSCIFYNAQQEDAKKVAHAYRIYGKKIKMVEQSLLEKLLNFPSASPSFSTNDETSPRVESDLSQASFSIASPSSSLDVSSKNSNLCPPSSVLESPNDATDKTKNVSKKQMGFSLSEFLSESAQESHKSEALQKSLKAKDSIISTPSEASVGSVTPSAVTPVTPQSPLFEAITKSPLPVFFPSKTSVQEIPGLSLGSSQDSSAPYSPSSPKSPISVSSKCSSSTMPDELKPVAPKASVVDDNLKSTTPVVSAVKNANDSKTAAPIVSVSNTCLKAPACAASSAEDDLKLKDSGTSSLQEGLAAAAAVSPSQDTSKPAAPAVSTVSESSMPSEAAGPTVTENSDDIDSLLDKAYHAQTKSKVNYKRKIDNLLRSKQAKSCKLGDSTEDVEENSQNSEKEKNVLASASQAQDVALVSKDVTEPVMPMDIVKPYKNVSSSSDSLLVPSSEQSCPIKDVPPPLPAIDKTELEPPNPKNLTHSTIASEEKATPVANSLGSLPEIPTEMLQNILKKYKESMNLNSSSKTQDSEVKRELPSGVVMAADISSSEKEVSKCVAPRENNASCKQEDIKMSGNLRCANEQSVIFKIDNANSSSNFTNSLQNMLNRFSKKIQPSQETDPNSNHIQHSPSISIENTLKLYSSLMKCYDKVDSINEQSFGLFKANTLSASLVKEVSCKDEAQTKKDSEQISIKQEPNQLCDNLEVMDMEVDSDEND